jgi:MFS family permease
LSSSESSETNRSSAVLSVGLLGDALLYLVLPVSYVEFGLTGIWVGVLLSANRFVRIAANGIVTEAARRYGLASIMLAGAILAAASTLSYGLLAGGIALLVARMVWGISFATLRLGSLGYATERSSVGTAGRLGRSGSIAQLGSLLAVTAGATMAQAIGVRETFIILGLITTIAIPVAMSLPRPPRGPRSTSRERIIQWPDAIGSTMGIVSFVADGLCIVSLAALLMNAGLDRPAAIATGGFLLAARQIALTVAPMIGGMLADRFGTARTLIAVMLTMIAALMMMATGAVAAGFLLVCPSAAIVATLLPGVAAERPGGDRLGRISMVVTWRDLGAAMGALATGSLLSTVDLSALYPIAAGLLCVATWWLSIALADC